VGEGLIFPSTEGRMSVAPLFCFVAVRTVWHTTHTSGVAPPPFPCSLCLSLSLCLNLSLVSARVLLVRQQARQQA